MSELPRKREQSWQSYPLLRAESSMGRVTRFLINLCLIVKDSDKNPSTLRSGRWHPREGGLGCPPSGDAGCSFFAKGRLASRPVDSPTTQAIHHPGTHREVAPESNLASEHPRRGCSREQPRFRTPRRVAPESNSCFRTPAEDSRGKGTR